MPAFDVQFTKVSQIAALDLRVTKFIDRIIKGKRERSKSIYNKGINIILAS